jgi:hypothetical protein
MCRGSGGRTSGLAHPNDISNVHLHGLRPRAYTSRADVTQHCLSAQITAVICSGGHRQPVPDCHAEPRVGARLSTWDSRRWPPSSLRYGSNAWSAEPEYLCIAVLRGTVRFSRESDKCHSQLPVHQSGPPGMLSALGPGCAARSECEGGGAGTCSQATGVYSCRAIAASALPASWYAVARLFCTIRASGYLGPGTRSGR